MADQGKTNKSRTVTHAEWALWAWTAWVCLFGLYQTRSQIPELERILAEDFQGLVVIAPSSLLWTAAIGYAALAAISLWIVLKIGAGKRWARSSLMWGFAFEILCAALPPYHKIGMTECLTAVPDWGLQVYAIYVLYSLPGSAWFPPKQASP